MIETENGAWPETRIHTEGASASHANVDNSVNKHLPQFVILSILVGFSLAVSLIGFAMLRDRVVDGEVETRMLEYYIVQSDAEMVRNGLKRPEDTFKFQQEHK